MVSLYKTRRGSNIAPLSIFLLLSMLSMGKALAHDPIFGQGPHTLFKGGTQIAIDIKSSKKGNKLENELGLEMKYGLTGNWVIGFELPYEIKTDSGNTASGLGDTALFTKYRFWRKDSLGLQQSAAISFKIISDTGNATASPALGTGTTDGVIGLSYGYEGRTWYRWASLRHRKNGTSNTGLQRGDRTLLDFVIGIRPTLTKYTEPDMVYMIELNGELGDQASLNGNAVTNSGGDEWFIAPGFMWTIKNFAIRSGVQLPISSSLNGSQIKSGYRAKLSFEWHF